MKQFLTGAFWFLLAISLVADSLILLAPSRAFITSFDTGKRTTTQAAYWVWPATEKFSRVGLTFAKDSRIYNCPSPENYLLNDEDLGHLFAAIHARSLAALQDSFKMSNCAPEHFKLNRGDYKELELKINRDGRLLLVRCGCLFEGVPRFMGKAHIQVPSHFWKAIYDDREQFLEAYIFPNQATDRPLTEYIVTEKELLTRLKEPLLPTTNIQKGP